MGNNKDIKRVLIVDDEPNIVAAIAFLMEQQAFEIRKAFNGREALQVAKDFHPHLIILDVMMPEMDGFEAASQVHSLPGMEDVRIIFLTAKGTREDQKQGFRSGGEIYLTKPFDNSELVSMVLETLEFG